MTATTDPGEPVVDREFEDFFERHHGDLGRLAYLLVGEHRAADHLTGDTLLAASRRWARLRELDDPLTEVRRLMSRIAAVQVRRLVRLGETSGRTFAATSPLHALTARGRACVTLRYAFGLPEREVASILGMRAATVRRQTTAALAQLVTSSGMPVPLRRGTGGAGSPAVAPSAGQAAQDER